MLQAREKASYLLAGTSSTRRKGLGIEYEDFRDYEYGDDIRFIDWRLSARSIKPDGEMRLITKEFRAEKEIHVVIAFDYTASLAFKNKYLASLYIATLLSEISSRLLDYVTFILISDKERIFPKINPAKIPYILLKHICKEKPKGCIGIRRIRDIYCNLGLKAPLYIITDYVNPYRDYIDIARIVRVANLRATFYTILAPEEILPSIGGRIMLIDPETGISMEAILDEFYAKARNHVALVRSALKLYSNLVEINGLSDAHMKASRIIVSYQLARRII